MSYLGRKGSPAPLVSSDIPDNSITGAKIVTDTIVAGDIGTNAVGADELANDAVDTNAIADDAVTGGKLANDIAISTTADIASTTGRVLIGDSPASYAATTADDLTIRPASGANGGITISSPQSNIFFSDDTSGAGLYAGAIQYTHSSGGSAVDRMDFYTNSASRMAIDSSGNVGIGTTSPDKKLDVVGEIRCTSAIWSTYSYSANISADTYRDGFFRNDGLFGTMSSSERYKKNIEDMGSIDWLYDLRPVEFDWKELNLAGKTAHDFGLIAEEVVKIRPEITTDNDKGEVDGVTYSRLIPFLLKAVQDLKTKNDALEAENTTLKTRMDALEAKVTALENA